MPSHLGFPTLALGLLLLGGSLSVNAQDESPDQLIDLKQAIHAEWSVATASPDDFGEPGTFRVDGTLLPVRSDMLTLSDAAGLIHHHLPTPMLAARWSFRPADQSLPYGMRLVFSDYRRPDMSVLLTATSHESWQGELVLEYDEPDVGKVRRTLRRFEGPGDLRATRTLELRWIHGMLTVIRNGETACVASLGTTRFLFSSVALRAETPPLNVEEMVVSLVPMGPDHSAAVLRYERLQGVQHSIEVELENNRFETVVEAVEQHNGPLRAVPNPAESGFQALRDLIAVRALADARHNEEAIKHTALLEGIPTGCLPEFHQMRLTAREWQAVLLRRTGRHEEALEVYAQLIDTSVRLNGPADIKTLGIQFNRSAVLVDSGNPGEAIRQLEAMLEHGQWENRDETSLLINILNNLGLARAHLGDQAGALEAHRRKMDVMLDEFGEQVVTTELIKVELLLNFAAALDANGQQLEAEAWFRRVYGPNGETPPELARLTPTHLANYAMLLYGMGQSDRSMVLMQTALDQILAEETGRGRDFATVLSSFAVQLADNGDLKQAIELQKESLRIVEAAGNVPPSRFLHPLRNLARFLSVNGDHESAQEYLDRAVAIEKELYRKPHPEAARNLIANGSLHLRRNEVTSAVIRLRQGVNALRQFFSDNHPEVVSARTILARALLSAGELTDAARESDATIAALLDSAAAVLPTRSEAGARLWIRQEPQLPYIAIAQAIGTREAIRNAYQHHWDLNARVSRFRGLRLTTPEAATEYRSLLNKVQALVLQQRQIGAGVEAGGEPTQDLAAVWKSDELASREELDKARHALQEFIRANCSESEQSLLMQRAVPNDLLGVLRPDSVVIEFAKSVEPVRPDENAGAADGVSANRMKTTDRYDAFVLRRTEEGLDIHCVPLGGSEEIDRAARQLHVSLSDANVSDDTCYQQAVELYRLVWQPLTHHLKSAGQVAVIPTGTLNLVPWDALPVDETQTQLIDHHTISIAEFAQQLCLPQIANAGRPRRLTVVGDVQYSADDESSADSPQPPLTADIDADPEARTVLRPVSASPSIEPADPVIRLRPGTRGGGFGHFGPLPFSLVEAQNTLRTFRETHRNGHATMLTRLDATPQRVLDAAKDSTHLHLATHAFFLSENSDVVLAIDPRRSAVATPGGVLDLSYSSSTLAVQNPFLLSELTLSPEATAVEETSGTEQPRPSFLVAEQIVREDLSTVELVTLSGCDTGIGEAIDGDVAASLRSAFHRSGARIVVSSLWRINDSLTSILMAEFYRNLWEGHQDYATALRNAKLSVRGELRSGKIQTPLPAQRGVDVKSVEVLTSKPVEPMSPSSWRLWAGFQVSGCTF